MGLTLTQKIVGEHLVAGRAEPGEEIALRIDQTRCPELAAALSCPLSEAMGISPPGDGVRSQIHLECFAVPGQTFLGPDSRTPACGALAMLAIIASDADVAAALAGQPFRLAMPATVLIRLAGRLGRCSVADELAREMPRPRQVGEGTACVLEYGGPGAATLTVAERAAICSLAAEMGALTAIFPSDAQTRAYLRAQQREEAWRPLAADLEAMYDEVIPLDLGKLASARSKTS